MSKTIGPKEAALRAARESATKAPKPERLAVAAAVIAQVKRPKVPPPTINKDGVILSERTDSLGRVKPKKRKMKRGRKRTGTYDDNRYQRKLMRKRRALGLVKPTKKKEEVKP